MKILVADDNRSIAKKVEAALKDQGFEVVGVAHGEAAVKALPDLLPDLVLADVFMPVRNGYEVCEYVKNDQRFSHIPVVLLIGAFDPIDQHEVKRVHADGLLKKPFDPPDDLLQMVRTMIAKYGPARSAREALLNVGDTMKLSDSEMKELLKDKTATAEPEPEAEEFAVRPARVEFGEGSEAMAFGELLETPAAEGPKLVEEAPRTEEPGFRASSVPNIEFTGTPAEEETSETPAPAAEPEAPSWSEMEAKADEGAVAAAPEAEAPQWGGVEVPAKEPSPDEPPIKVEFDSSEAIELVTEESAAPAPSLVESGPLPELATSPDEFMAAAATTPAAPESHEAPAMEVEPFTVPAMEEIAAPPVAESPVSFPAPEPPVVAEFEAASKPAQMMPPPIEFPSSARPMEMDASAAAAAAAAPAYSGNTDAFGRPAHMNAADMDAIVEKVIARLQKGVLDQITRDILRPIVEALVAREVEKQK